MTAQHNLVAIYDFELFPFALGDVLTWNIRTAMRCEELGRARVDLYICANEGCLGSVHQRGVVNAQNFDLLFNELYSAFGTNPRLGNIHIFRRREELIARVQEIVSQDEVNAEAVRDYLGVLNYRVVDSAPNRLRGKIFRRMHGSQMVRRVVNRYVPSVVKKAARDVIVSKAFLPDYDIINHYFTKYVVSHESINAFAARRGGIPLLRPAFGCEPDIEELIARRFLGKKIVPFHLRLRRLDTGYGGEHSYVRDSNFLEWYDFLSEASRRYPEVEFIALGRLQEKPLELLRLPNVTSLRIFGMGLGHELTLMLKSDLFIGTSSGFAAMANFSSVPYFITHMNPGSCHVYAIPEGADRLPFAREGQKLVYEPETSELLMRLLEEGLKLVGHDRSYRGEASNGSTPEPGNLDIAGWLNARLQVRSSAATTSRFFADDKYRREETAYLLLLNLEQARQALLCGEREKATGILQRMMRNFPDLCGQLTAYRKVNGVLENAELDFETLQARLKEIDIQVSGFAGSACPVDAVTDGGWRPLNWIVTSSSCKPLQDEAQPALAIQATGANSYWHTEQFVCSRSDGKIILRFDAKNSEFPSYHRIHVFEDQSYYSVGQFVAEPDWRTFEIPITTNAGALLELQVDQADPSQWLMIRDFRVVNAIPVPLLRKAAVNVPMVGWSTNWEAGKSCTDAAGHDCLQWIVAGKEGYVQTPSLPRPGEDGMLICFEARTDRPTASFTQVYLFEGDQYRTVAQYAFNSDWREFSLLLKPSRDAPLKVQVDYPNAVTSFSIRNFKAIPVQRDNGPAMRQA